jgi:hypothetical protein
VPVRRWRVAAIISAVQWQRFAADLGFVPVSGQGFNGGDNARAAIAVLLGDDALRSAVDSCVDRDPGEALANSVLSLLKPQAARDYCLRIVRHDRDTSRRQFAASLFKDMATGDDLPVVAELLAHPDPQVPVWAVALLRVLAYDDEDLPTGPYGVMMREHTNPRVQTAYTDNFDLWDPGVRRRAPGDPGT